MPDTKRSLGTKDQVQTSNLCVNCQQPPGLGNHTALAPLPGQGPEGQAPGRRGGQKELSHTALWTSGEKQQDLIRKTEGPEREGRREGRPCVGVQGGRWSKLPSVSLLPSHAGQLRRLCQFFLL